MEKPPFRADHVGSLLRPQPLLQARAAHQAGTMPAEELRQHEDAAIREAIAMQEAIGLVGVTDGEFRRRDWLMDFKFGLAGVTRHAGSIGRVPFQSASGPVEWTFEQYTVDGRLRLERTIFGADFAFLKAGTKATAKLTIPSPSMMHYPAGRGIDRRVYPDDAEYFRDVAAVYAAEIAGLARLGCTYLQIDDTSFATLCDPEQRASLSRAGADGEHIHETYIRVFNDVLKAKPAGMTVSTHTCRGNHRSAWFASGGYDFIAEALFNELKVDAFFLEYDDERSGGFEPLRVLPKGKFAVLGLVSTKQRGLESKDALKRRIDQAAKFAPLEQLCLSPQCGFSSTLEGNDLTEAEQFAKLGLLVEVARDIWG